MSRLGPLLSIMLLLAFGAGQSWAQDVPATLTIQDERENELARYTPAELERAFTLHEVVTATPWSVDGKALRFRGVYLADILKKYSLNGRDLEAGATDNYVTTIPAADIADYAPVVATGISCLQGEPACVDGFRPLTIKDSGPFYVIWPLDRVPDYFRDTKNNYWVWFLARLRPAEK